MKIGNAFSLNMVELPATIKASKITLETIKNMMEDYVIKKGARKLLKKGISMEKDDEFIYINFNGNCVCWSDRDDEQRKIESLAVIGLEQTREMLEVIYSAIYNDCEVLSLKSVIGHDSTAKIVSEMIGVDLPMNRSSVKLSRGEKIIVAQYTGPDLPEGVTTLPEGAKIEFILVEVN